METKFEEVEPAEEQPPSGVVYNLKTEESQKSLKSAHSQPKKRKNSMMSIDSLINQNETTYNAVQFIGNSLKQQAN